MWPWALIPMLYILHSLILFSNKGPKGLFPVATKYNMTLAQYLIKCLYSVCIFILALHVTHRPITGSAVALHCCKAYSKSIGKMENSTPCKIVTPENFILKLGIRDYVENITHYTNFHVHRFSGGFSTNRWNITLLWLLFLSCPVLSCPFFSFTRPARTARPIFAVYGSNDVVPPKDGPFGVRTISDIIWGKCAPKTPQKGAWIGIFKPN